MYLRSTGRISVGPRRPVQRVDDRFCGCDHLRRRNIGQRHNHPVVRYKFRSIVFLNRTVRTIWAGRATNTAAGEFRGRWPDEFGLHCVYWIDFARTAKSFRAYGNCRRIFGEYHARGRIRNRRRCICIRYRHTHQPAANRIL